ncbi:hypothetical protein EXN66_Car010767 [Channa argus]|uniref:Uncharacterized protein n=1 Tax=Channa argus TaxID=215402 RepID=A0A6G1PXM5_CHAAH|nr:hypothetical protein EXN66_Car010767 [Channa argus]
MISHCGKVCHVNCFLIDIFECSLSFIDSLTYNLPVSKTDLKTHPHFPNTILLCAKSFWNMEGCVFFEMFLVA